MAQININKLKKFILVILSFCFLSHLGFSQHSYRTLFLDGKVGNWSIFMSVDIRDNKTVFDGQYFCKDNSCKDKSNPAGSMHLIGEMKKSKLSFYETIGPNNEKVGFFSGTVKDSIYKGTWTSIDKKEQKNFQFTIKEYNKVGDKIAELWGTDDSSRIFVDSIILKNIKSKKVFQSIDLTKYQYRNYEIPENKKLMDSLNSLYDLVIDGSTMWTAGIGAEDMNFDGVLDFQVTGGTGANGCSNYNCFIFDKASNSFIKNFELESLGTDLTFNAEDSTVSTSNHCCVCYVSSEIFKYYQGHYYKIEENLMECEKTIYRAYKIENGKSVLIKESIEVDEEVEDAEDDE